MSDVATTRRRAMSPTRRLRIWEQNKGICALCSLPIDGAREPWIVEHLRALALGGEDRDANCAPVHAHCAEAKTRGQDMPAIVKAKRQKMKALGIRKPSSFSHPFLKRLMNGKVVDRRTGQELSR